MTGILTFIANTLAWFSIMLGYIWFAWEMSYEPGYIVFGELEGEQ